MKDGKISYPVEGCPTLSYRIVDAKGRRVALVNPNNDFIREQDTTIRDTVIADMNAAHTQWQPIETAPMNGNAIRLCRHAHVPVTCYWAPAYDNWMIAGAFVPITFQPTHWAECERMPTPPLPQPDPEPEPVPVELLRRALDVLHQHACTSREAIRIDRDGRNFLAAHDRGSHDNRQPIRVRSEAVRGTHGDGRVVAKRCMGVK